MVIYKFKICYIQLNLKMVLVKLLLSYPSKNYKLKRRRTKILIFNKTFNWKVRPCTFLGQLDHELESKKILACVWDLVIG